MCKSVKERQLENQECDDTPSVRELYDVILEMANKMSAMERKMNDMSKWVDSKKRKINIIDWLNQNHKDIETTEDLIDRIKVEYSHLEYLFEEDYISTILLVLKEILPLDQDTIPVKAFDIKPNTLFVYTGGTRQLRNPVSPPGGITSCMGGTPGGNTSYTGADSVTVCHTSVNTGADVGAPRWIIMPDKLFQDLVNEVMKQLLDEFIIWQKANASKMDQDDFAIKYANNARKIMGAGLPREQIYGKVKVELYKYLKVNVKNITEYQFL